ncbi:MAG: DUF5915 domain-containing protein, partial [Thermoplasmata archaeon]
YDSGSAPFAQFHYPFENEDKFEEAFPIDFITEALDQTRGWFYSLLAISSLLYDKPAYKSCLTLGLVLDEDGEKMSKSKGNAVEPTEILDEIGADAIRLYFLSSPVWKSTLFNEDMIQEKVSKIINTLTNVISFFTSNANIDDFTPSEYEVSDEIDRWLISRTNSLVKDVRYYLDELEVHKSTREIEKFIDELSNWYLRRSRRRFWEGTEEEKESAYNTLYRTLRTLNSVMAPFVPFITERIYQNTIKPVKNGLDSVHMADYPVSSEDEIDKELEVHMSHVMKIAELGRNARQKENIKLRQPLREAVVVSENSDYERSIELFSDILMDELNVKDLKVIEDESALTVTSIAPNYSSLGPKFKGDANKVAEAINAADPVKLKNSIEENGVCELDGFNVDKDDLDMSEEVKEDYIASEDGDLRVFINSEIDEELEIEGLARDVVRRIQTMRKDLELGYTQKIHTRYRGNLRLQDAIEEMNDYIKKETLSDTLEMGAEDGYKKEWSIDGKEITIWVDPL